MTRLLSLAMLAASVVACAADPTGASETTDPAPNFEQKGCASTSVGLTPLTDLGGAYHGEPGGLYPGGSSTAPPAHLTAGLALARTIGPLDAEGRASASGRYAFISIGMSNTTQEFSTFVPMANADPLRRPELAVVDGAQGGVTAADWVNPGCSCWPELDKRLQAANLTPGQVATAWIKLADRQPAQGWPAQTQLLKTETVGILQLLKSRFPNLRLAYFSSRIYAGYATSTLNPEPYAYEGAFAMRWVIEDQINGTPELRFAGAGASSPWVAWGPYLWADGTKPRSDGLTWVCADFQSSDGTHPSTSGRQKVAAELLNFVHNDQTASVWYKR